MSISFHHLYLGNPLCSTIRCKGGFVCDFINLFMLMTWFKLSCEIYEGIWVWCRKGDYYRYLAEFKSGNERKEAADQSLKAYEVCMPIFYSVYLRCHD